MIFMTDQWNRGSRDLLESLQSAGFSMPAIATQYDGFLPEGVDSPYGYYLEEDLESGKPLFFHHLKVPAFWEVAGNSSGGEIRNESELMGRIFYAEPGYKRYVRIVDWMDRSGRVRCSDHYNKYGRRFAQTILDEKQKPILKTYYLQDGTEKISENFVTGVILLRDGEQTIVFRNKSEFVVHYLREMGYELDHILYNSLSTPYFVSQRLGRDGIKGEDLLFWQEDAGKETPANLRVILEGRASRTGNAIIQHEEVYEALKARGVGADRLYKLGIIYPMAEVGHNRGALILTNSDQIPYLEELLRALPSLHVTVAAQTEMSGKLQALGKYENVTLLPGIHEGIARKLIAQNGIYLDINKGNEIFDGSDMAFRNGLLLFAWKETIHGKGVIHPANVFRRDTESAGLVLGIQNVLSNDKKFEEKIKEQRAHALTETIETYQEILKKLLHI